MKAFAHDAWTRDRLVAAARQAGATPEQAERIADHVADRLRRQPDVDVRQLIRVLVQMSR